jgi:ubiquinone/menaquinone biosynthesis C-methylase UbiE
MTYTYMLKKLIPSRIRRKLGRRWKYYRTYGLFNRNPLLPPPDLVQVSSIENFTETGRDWANKLVKVGKLENNHGVLEVGCGIGRVAIFLTEYLTEGEYFGFDIRQDEIVWLDKNITARFPTFHFEYSNVYNAFYNPEGMILAHEYRFPYSDNFFDLVYLTSVFTHMLPRDIENYLREVKRVMKVEGRCFISYFLLNTESKEHIAQGQSSRNFGIQIEGGCFSDNVKVPEDAVAYEESYIRNLYKVVGFEIEEPIHYGVWHKSQVLNAARDYQDIIVAKKLPHHLSVSVTIGML